MLRSGTAMSCCWSLGSIWSQYGQSCSTSGTIFRAVTKNSAMAWAGEAKKKMVSVTPRICQPW